MSLGVIAAVVGVLAYFGSCIYQFKKLSREDGYEDRRKVHSDEPQKSQPKGLRK